jgi:2-polyprenyl-6-methoxyphenol hydroxylase-like FAD-dependent oxidoreductase
MISSIEYDKPLSNVISTRCCIAGGGPAGLMLGLLLARAGVEVVVLEKHADFLRDFRGDTIHPSTLEIMHELGFLEEFLKLPHYPVPRLVGQFGELRAVVADFSHLPTRAKFIAMMPQWDFLGFLAEKARRYKMFQLIMQAEAQSLIKGDSRILGVRAASANGPMELRADLVVAADGRDSTLRGEAGLAVEELGAPMDVLWFRLSRHTGDTDQTQGRFDAGRIFIMLNRGDYWQCAFVIPKGWNERVSAAGLDTFRRSVGTLVPFDSSRANDIQSWEQVKLLTVQVNRLKRWWREGLLCIGDAAHAMSPVGGVGVNLAVQDAVAASNVLADPLRQGRLSVEHLARIQKRRDWPTRVTQQLQLAIQNRVIAPALAEKGQLRPPLALRAISRIPGLNRIPARLLGLGVRPEHVRTHSD